MHKPARPKRPPASHLSLSLSLSGPVLCTHSGPWPAQESRLENVADALEAVEGKLDHALVLQRDDVSGEHTLIGYSNTQSKVLARSLTPLSHRELEHALSLERGWFTDWLVAIGKFVYNAVVALVDAACLRGQGVAPRRLRRASV